MPSDLQVSNIRDLNNANSAISIASDGQVTIAQNNPTIQLGSNATFPAGQILQVVNGTGGNISPVTHNGATWTTLETLGTTITVNKGNKVLVIANSVNWYTSGTNNNNASVRIKLSDGTNTDYTNDVLLWTQNFSINVVRMYGTSHSGIVTTATGSGTVVVTAYVQGSTESGATINYSDTNTGSEFGYTLFEIQA